MKRSFSEYYSFYLEQHAHAMTKMYHVAAVLGGSSVILYSLVTFNLILGLCGVALGYTLAWIPHLFVERNLPLSFKNPVFALLAALKMTWDILLGRIPLEGP